MAHQRARLADVFVLASETVQTGYEALLGHLGPTALAGGDTNWGLSEF